MDDEVVGVVPDDNKVGVIFGKEEEEEEESNDV